MATGVSMGNAPAWVTENLTRVSVTSRETGDRPRFSSVEDAQLSQGLRVCEKTTAGPARDTPGSLLPGRDHITDRSASRSTTHFPSRNTRSLFENPYAFAKRSQQHGRRKQQLSSRDFGSDHLICLIKRPDSRLRFTWAFVATCAALRREEVLRKLPSESRGRRGHPGPRLSGSRRRPVQGPVSRHRR